MAHDSGSGGSAVRVWVPELPPAREAADGPGFRLMSYNILAPLFARPEDHPQIPAELLDWEQRGERIVRDILDLQPDVVCLLECDRKLVKGFFTDQLAPHGYEAVPGLYNGAAGYGLLYRREQFMLVSGPQRVKIEQDMSIRDCAAFVTLFSLPAKRFLVLAATHLEGKPDLAYIRVAQITACFDKAAQLSARCIQMLQEGWSPELHHARSEAIRVQAAEEKRRHTEERRRARDAKRGSRSVSPAARSQTSRGGTSAASAVSAPLAPAGAAAGLAAARSGGGSDSGSGSGASGTPVSPRTPHQHDGGSVPAGAHAVVEAGATAPAMQALTLATSVAAVQSPTQSAGHAFHPPAVTHSQLPSAPLQPPAPPPPPPPPPQPPPPPEQQQQQQQQPPPQAAPGPLRLNPASMLGSLQVPFSISPVIDSRAASELARLADDDEDDDGAESPAEAPAAGPPRIIARTADRLVSGSGASAFAVRPSAFGALFNAGTTPVMTAPLPAAETAARGRLASRSASPAARSVSPGARSFLSAASAATATSARSAAPTPADEWDAPLPPEVLTELAAVALAAPPVPRLLPGVCICMDMNDVPNSQPYAAGHAHPLHLRSAYATVLGHEPTATFHGRGEPQCTIDFCFVGGGLAPVRVLDVRPPPGDAEIPAIPSLHHPSDHLPIAMDLQWTAVPLPPPEEEYFEEGGAMSSPPQPGVQMWAD